MRFFFRKLICTAVAFALLLSLQFPCSAASKPQNYDVTGKTLDEIITDFMAEYKLTEKNFSMGWYNTGTGETWYYNENKFMVAGSMYKLPLCMNYIGKFDDGSFDPTAKTGGYQLTRLIDLAITYSDNNAASLLQKYYSPDHDAYRLSLTQYSDVDPETLPDGFFRNNEFSPHIILDTLKALYNDQDYYRQIVDDMLQAHPARYFRKYQGDYEIAHKYGYFEGSLNDCGIIYTPTPYLLVAFTDHVYNSEEALAVLVQRLTDYSLWLDSEAERIAAVEAERAAEEAEQARIAAEKAAEQARINAAEEAEAKAEAERIAAEEQASVEALAAAESALLKKEQNIKLSLLIGIPILLIASVLVIRWKKRKHIYSCK